MFKKAYFSWLIAALVATAIVVNNRLALSAPPSSPDTPTTLRVLLYPYVPDRLSLFQKIEAVFEREHPGVNLELVEDANDNYYSGGLQKAEADVYEVDTILLSDLIALKKIAPIEFRASEFTASGVAAVTRNGKTYAVPHWLCGNFLFYKKGDRAGAKRCCKQIESASSWTEIVEI